MVLQYDSRYFIRSLVQRQTDSLAFVDDLSAVQDFTTTKPLVMLVIYNTMNYHGSPHLLGTKITVMIDGVDQDGIGVRHDQLSWENRKNGCTVYYLGTLAAGNHTVKGRFAICWGTGVPCTIDERQLAIFLFDGAAADWGFASGSVVRTNATNVWADDPDASVTVTLPEDDMIVLALYSASCQEGDGEGVKGKEIAIQVDADSERGWHGQSCAADSPNGCTSHVIYSTLAAGVHTFDGRFRSNENTVAVKIRHRQLAILVFSPEQLWDQVLDDVTAVQWNEAAVGWIDDTPAVVNRNLPDVYQALILYGNYNYDGVTQRTTGRKSVINVDGTEYSEGHQAFNVSDNKLGNTVVHVRELAAGAHTIQGRFSSNVAFQPSTISRRTLSVLYFRREEIGPHKQSILQKIMRGGI